MGMIVFVLFMFVGPSHVTSPSFGEPILTDLQQAQADEALLCLHCPIMSADVKLAQIVYKLTSSSVS